MTLGERIRALRRSQQPKMSQTEFGNVTGVTRAQIATYELNTVSAPESYLKLLCMRFNVSILWLKEGYGEMYLTPDTGEEMVDRIMAGENDFAKSIMRAFARLEDADWQQLEAIVNKLKGASR